MLKQTKMSLLSEKEKKSENLSGIRYSEINNNLIGSEEE
jgi:hypothetical protein